MTVFEAAAAAGGGMRTESVVSPGVVHDVCSAIHPLALASPFFREFELSRRVEFVVPEASYAHPLYGSGAGVDSRAAVAYRDLSRTASELGRDGAAYARLYRPLLGRLDGVVDLFLGGSPVRWPRDPFAALAALSRALEQGSSAWGARFREEAAPALIAGVAAHAIGRQPRPSTAAAGLLLGALGHTVGWPVPRGGSGAIAAALVSDLVAHGGRIETDHLVSDLRSLGDFDVLMFDTSVAGFASIASEVLPASYARSLRRFRFGNAAAKVDFVLDGPIPWADERVAAAPTVHVGGSRTEIASAERLVARGRHPERPYVLVAQTAAFDPTRNAAGVHAVSSYTHVPRGSRVDVSSAVIAQLERFAPGFRDIVRDVRVTTAVELSSRNPNYVGGDIGAGAVTLRQLLARPIPSWAPWRTPVPGVYLCSASTAPGPGVHGLGGWYAARLALRDAWGLEAPSLALAS